jgi:hypothetical protein
MRKHGQRSRNNRVWRPLSLRDLAQGWKQSLPHLALLLTLALPCQAQIDQFGGQQRADAAQQMIVLAVQQAISSLPPTSAQAFAYEFDPASDTYVRSTLLGPTAFLSARTIGKGKLALRVATSYFELSESFGPMQYLVQFDEPFPDGPFAGLQPAGIGGFGLDVSAKVVLVNLSASYGLANRVEGMFNLPITVVQARASQPFTTPYSALDLPLDEAFVGGVFQERPLSPDPQRRAAEIAGLRQAFDERVAPGCSLGADLRGPRLRFQSGYAQRRRPHQSGPEGPRLLRKLGTAGVDVGAVPAQPQ